MFPKVLVLLFLVPCVFSCVIYTFENNLKEFFSTGRGMCVDYALGWNIGQYRRETNVKSYHEQSTQFIYPQQEMGWSCVSSSVFDMTSHSIVEVNVFMENTTGSDVIQIVVLNEAKTIIGMRSVSGAVVASGWNTITVPINSLVTHFKGQVSILGVRSPGSTVLVDSFRYVVPNSSSNCEIYESYETTSYIPECDTELVTESVTEAEEVHETTTESAADYTYSTTEGVPDSAPDCNAEKVIKIEITTTITIKFG